MSVSGLGNPDLTYSGDRIAPERYNTCRSPLNVPLLEVVDLGQMTLSIVLHRVVLH